MRYMVSDAENGSSIRNCLQAARENARAVRGTLTTEVWETQNQTWLEFQRMVATNAFQRDPGAGVEWVKFRAHLSRGVSACPSRLAIASTLLRIAYFLHQPHDSGAQ